MDINNLEELVKYVQKGDCLIVRNIEKSEEGNHWIENYAVNEGEKPEVIPITENLFLDCLDSGYFPLDKENSSKFEFYLEYNARLHDEINEED